MVSAQHFGLCDKVDEVLTDQLWFKLVLTVSVAQSSIATLAPSEELSAGGDTGAVCSSGSDIHHFNSPQGLNYTRTVTGAEVKRTHSYYKSTILCSYVLYSDMSLYYCVCNELKIQGAK